MSEAVAELESQSEVADSTAEAQEEEVEEAANGKAYFERLAEQRASRQPKTEDSPRVESTSPLLDPRAAMHMQEYKNLHQQRQGAVDGLVSDLEEFVPPQILKAHRNELKSLLNAHNSDGIRLAGFEAAATAVNYEQENIQNALAVALPAAQLKKLADRMQANIQAKGVATYQDTFKDVVALAREGYIAEAQYAKDVQRAYDDGLKGREKREKTADRSNAAAGRISGSAPASSGKKPTTLAEAYAQHARGMISNAEMTQYKRTLT